MQNNLKKTRKDAGLTQKEVAERCGITEGAYQKYEYNKRVPILFIALKIAKVLNSKVEILFQLEDQE